MRKVLDVKTMVYSGSLHPQIATVLLAIVTATQSSPECCYSLASGGGWSAAGSPLVTSNSGSARSHSLLREGRCLL